MHIKTLKAETHGFLFVNFAQVVVETFDFQPVAVWCDHFPPGQIVERGAPQHSLFATGIHGDVAANARGLGGGWVHGKNESSPFCGFGDTLGNHASAGAYGADGMVNTWQVHKFNRCDVDQFLGIDHHRVGGERHGTAGVTGAASTRNDGEAELDAVTHQRTDFFFGVRVEHHERIFDAPIGGVSHV